MEEEIEATPEMIESGWSVIEKDWIDFLSETEAAKEILYLAYKAMYEARPRQ